MSPAVGALIAVGTALTYSHYKTQLWFGIVCWLMTLVVVLGMLSFSLDAIQTRTAIRPDMYRSYEVATVTAEAKLLLGAFAFGFMGRARKPQRWGSRLVEGWLEKR